MMMIISLEITIGLSQKISGNTAFKNSNVLNATGRQDTSQVPLLNGVQQVWILPSPRLVSVPRTKNSVNLTIFLLCADEHNIVRNFATHTQTRTYIYIYNYRSIDRYVSDDSKLTILQYIYIYIYIYLIK